jgi:thioredoxin reductase (NADPH)
LITLESYKKIKMSNKVKVLIIGSGPSGYTAAIYAARAGLSPLLFQGDQPGGQLTITNDVENYPGYPKGVNGPQMMMDFQEQATRFGSDIRNGFVTEVEFKEGNHRVVVDGKDTFFAETVIISTGAAAKWLGLPSEDKFKYGGGVTACAVCDGFFYKKQDVIVVGAGDTACEEAHYLSKICNKVHLFVRRDEMRASKIMQQRVQNTPNIEIHWNTSTLEILGDDVVIGAKVQNTLTKEEKVIDATGFFVAIGHKPNTEIFKGQIELDENGYILTKAGTTQTNQAGVFASGDAQDSIYRQAVTAAGTGCMAALEAERYLAAREG